jgi:group II intron reverse transcriptase/maturase
MHGNIPHGNREIPDPTALRAQHGPRRESARSTTAMNGPGKSDNLVVPENPPNEGSGAPFPEEAGEGRGLAEGNPLQRPRLRTQDRFSLQAKLERIRQAAGADPALRFTTLWHHVYDVERLRAAYFSLKKEAAPGIDGTTWHAYGARLEEHLQDLSARLQRGAYRAQPVKRVFIPKSDGRERPIGMPTLEDKLVQRAAAEVMGAVYEMDFKGFSYGFRPNRGAHHALDALTVGLTRKKVNWVLDADIRGFFDALDHGWLVKFIEHRITDARVVRHVKKWLNAGVLEKGRWTSAGAGTPQGGSISPLLANVYLHYVLDLWASAWRRRAARGDVILVRYADDFVVGFEHREDAERFLAALRERFAKFHLELHPEKTRLLEFGRFAARDRARRGEGKPPTFDFLGFTHICGRTRAGKFKVLRQTMKKRMRAKLKALKAELRARMHDPVPEVGRWLGAVVSGYNRYFAVPGNGPALSTFRHVLVRLWRRSLSRRSQNGQVSWTRMSRLASRYLPTPRILHPYPSQRLCVIT